ncbi:trimethylamine-N-oxide reductase TorA [Sulfurospirillum multivorans]|uniref:trimethylamine-N-oxide reductase n=2 Tax=Sulfurospirillum multivorans TaxID=66821 RepID=A0AA86DYU4_SULMK|nr:trimethylamine-N-oxide reductase TorA [Sulfurospirillum multivorans]AHJ11775.1 trimethylamine-N-oxide reductase-like protein [Sulfurospirillum multivorans DSM 12446]QEH05281.1 trimethylamine-N-oxide reductase-like protein [Sulfurospirillum multivorans]
MTKNMDRRSFLKVGGAAAGVAVATVSAEAIPLVGDSILQDGVDGVSASHFGAVKTKVRNGRFESVEAFEGDSYPSTLIQGLPARTYAQDRILYPCVREGYLKNGYKSDKSKRGSDKYVRVSWEKAFDLIADELKRVYKSYGPDAVFGGSYGWFCVGSLNNPQALVGRMLGVAGGYTSRTLTYSTHAIRAITPYVTGGDESSNQQTAYPNLIANSECIVFWSSDPINTNQIAWGVPDHQSYEYMKQLKAEAKKRNIKFYCIDPVYNNTAMYFGAEHIKVRPTTDVAMMLGMAHYLYSENLYSKEFVEKYTSGFAEFKAYLLGEGEDKVIKTPEWAAKICGVEASVIKMLAKEFASKRTMLMGGWGFQRAHHGEQPHWMLITLASMLGQIGLAGGGFGCAYHYSDGGVPAPAAATGNPLSDVKMGNGSQGAAASADAPAASPGLTGISVNSKVDGPWKQRKIPVIPVSRIVECLENPGREILFDGKKLTYPDLKMAYWAGGNPFHHHQDRNRMIKAWQKFETFVVNECFWTATARMADIVLPATTEQERNDITKSHTNSYIFAMKKAVEPVGEAMDDFDIFVNILRRFSAAEVLAFTEGKSKMEWIKSFYDESYNKAKKSGVAMPAFDEFWEKGFVKFETPEAAKNFIKYKTFRDNPVTNRLGTPSGKIEIFSKKIAGYGYKECKGHPTWFEPMEWLGSSVAKEFPLNLVSPHPKYRLHSQLNNTWLRDLEEVQGREPIWMHPKDAAKRGIQNGDVVRIFNKRGQVLGGAVVTEAVMEGVVRMQEGAWYDPKEPGKIGSLCVHGDVNVLIADVPTSELAQGNQATALVEIEKFKGEIPAIGIFKAPVMKGM